MISDLDLQLGSVCQTVAKERRSASTHVGEIFLSEIFSRSVASLVFGELLTDLDSISDVKLFSLATYFEGSTPGLELLAAFIIIRPFTIFATNTIIDSVNCQL